MSTLREMITKCLVDDGIDMTGVTVIDPLEVEWLRLGSNPHIGKVGIMFKSGKIATALHIPSEQAREFALKLLEMCNKATIT